MKTLQEQSEIVKERLHYHFAKVGGGWNIEHMNAPFTKEFLNEVERLCALSDVVDTEGQLPQNFCTLNRDTFHKGLACHQSKLKLLGIGVVSDCFKCNTIDCGIDRGRKCYKEKCEDYSG